MRYIIRNNKLIQEEIEITRDAGATIKEVNSRIDSINSSLDFHQTILNNLLLEKQNLEELRDAME